MLGTPKLSLLRRALFVFAHTVIAYPSETTKAMPGASERTPLIANGSGNGNGNAKGPKAAVGNRPPPLKYELSTPRFVAIL